MTSSSFGIWKSISRAHSSWSSQEFWLVLHSSTYLVFPRCSVTATLSPPSGHITAPAQLAPYCPFHPLLAPYCYLVGVVDLRSLYKISPRLHPSSWQLLNAALLSHRAGLFGVLSTPIVYLLPITSLFPGTASSSRPILSFPKLLQISVIFQGYISFVRGSYFSFVLILFVAVVAQGSPLLPACFFPVYFLCIYMYVSRIWVRNRREVRLVSYHRDFGVWMFAGGRRIRVFVGHSNKLHAVFVP